MGSFVLIIGFSCFTDFCKQVSVMYACIVDQGDHQFSSNFSFQPFVWPLWAEFALSAKIFVFLLWVCGLSVGLVEIFICFVWWVPQSVQTYDFSSFWGWAIFCLYEVFCG